MAWKNKQLKIMLILLVSILFLNSLFMLSIKKSPAQSIISKVISPQEDAKIAEESNQKTVSKTIDLTNNLKNSAQNYTLSKPYNILLSSTEITDSLVSEREIFC